MSTSTGFVVYRSSAGSGKTFTLVKEYLKLALEDGGTPPTRFRSINAITFTNKAAAEMKERVISTLKGISAGDPKTNSYTETLAIELNIQEDLLRTRAGELLTAILHNYSDFSISTIDSFTHRVIRAFSADLQLSSQFEISTDRHAIITEAVDMFLDGIQKEDPLTSFLLDFLRQFVEEEKDWDIRRELISFTETLSKLEDAKKLNALLKLDPSTVKKIRSELYGFMHSFQTQLSAIGKEALQILEEHDLQIEDLPYKSKGIAGWFRYLSEWRDDKLFPNINTEKTIREDKWITGKPGKGTSDAINAAAPLLKEKYDQVVSTLNKEASVYFLYKLIYRNINLIAIYRSIHLRLEEYRKENNIILISDLNQLIASIVAEQPAPFIYERLGSRYKHYLIDEFQDTSVLQWTNLLPLVHQSLSEGSFNMVVGDGKQAIYRFRGGEVTQFTRLPEMKNDQNNELLEERARSLKDHFQLKHLGVNYRSLPAIVQFNNELYSALSAGFSPLIRDVFSNNDQKHSNAGEGGHVNIEFLDPEKDHAVRTEELIQELMARNYSLNSIAILTRNNKEASTIAAHLQTRGIPVISSDSMLVAASPKVQFLLALLRIAEEPSNIIARATAAEYLSKTGKTRQTKSELFAIVSDRKAFLKFLSDLGFDPLEKKRKTLSLPEFTEQLMAKINERQGADPYLLSFSDLVLQFTKRKGNDLPLFLEWWEERKEKEFVTVPEGINAVRIMTIHKSKGLEFPVVILPESNWDMQKLHDKVWIDLGGQSVGELSHAILPVTSALENTPFNSVLQEEKEKSLLDNLNLLYVATTRAAKEMHILTAFPKKKNDLSNWFQTFLLQKDLFDKNKSRYFFGEPLTETKQSESSPATTLSHFISLDWRDRIRLRRRNRDRAGIGFHTGSRNKGLLIHKALSLIKKPAELDEVLSRMIKKGQLMKEDHNVLKNELHSILSSENIRSFFISDNILCEKDLLLPDGEIIRPDRLLLSPNATTVIDFKTGIEKKEHLEQVRIYSGILEKAGYPNVSAYLIYTDNLLVKKAG